MRLLDEQYTKRPYYGIRRMTAVLQAAGYEVNHKRVARILRLMGQLSPPPERFWVGTVETFERSNCHTLPNAVMFSGYQVSWLKPRF